MFGIFLELVEVLGGSICIMVIEVHVPICTMSCTTDARYWVPDRAAAFRQAEKQQGETAEEAAERSDLQMAMSYKAWSTILEFIEYRSTVENMNGWWLRELRACDVFWRAPEAVHERMHDETCGCANHLTRENGQPSSCVMAIRFSTDPRR